ncbi:MAG: transposase family protein [Gammaproteobacteria bacterium]|nr:transposase family protein [Gammaproteobacteria bacterium]
MKNQSYYESLKQRLENANHGEKKAIVISAAEFLGVSEMTIHRNLNKVGYDCGRKSRSDKGNTTISVDELKIIAALVRSSERKNDKSLMPIKVAIEVAYENGKIKELYNEGTVSRLLRENNLSPKQMKQAKPHISLKTEHPNQLWQLDPSICVLYYLKDGKSMAVMDKDKFYQNKMENLYKIANERVFRYAVTDHCSGAFYCKYYMARGENQEVLFDFLMTAMGEKDKQKNPFEGVPQMLYWDKGSANQSNMIKNLLNQLGVNHSAHTAGNSRAKGQVEKTNDIIERHFEGRLYLMKVESIEQLNLQCEYWQRDFQSNPRYAHTRHKMPRFTAWRKITNEQLVTRPPIDVCKMLLSDKACQREVKGNYQIPFEGRRYSLSEVDNIAIGKKVSVSVNPYAYPNIRVKYENRFGEMITYDIAPLEVDEFGFTSDSVTADVMNGGHHHQAPLTVIDRNRQDIDEIAYGTRDEQEIDRLRNNKSAVAFNGEIDPFSYLKDRNDNNDTIRIPKRGKPLDVGEPALQKVEKPSRPSLETVVRDEPILPVINFIKWYAKNHDISPAINTKIREQYADGLRESDYESIAEKLLNPKLQKVV